MDDEYDESAGLDVAAGRRGAQARAGCATGASDATARRVLPSSSIFFQPVLSDELFAAFADLVDRELGIKMPPAKKTMLNARLRKRMRELGMETFEEYADHVFGDRGGDDELYHMLDVVTTNKTDFFREPRHFDILVGTVLPEIIRSRPAGEPLRLWSAGCSSGEEPYTLAMVLSDFCERHRGLDFTVFATDVSGRILERALGATYTEQQARPIPEEFKKKYLLRSKDSSRGLVRVAKSVRDRVTFRRINFMHDDFGFGTRMDVVFFRNVLIYFERRRQEAIIGKIAGHLAPWGHLFIGHSETMLGMDLPLAPVANSVYRIVAPPSFP
jgi:chemotaxis protein methyltransferase CheR